MRIRKGRGNASPRPSNSIESQSGLNTLDIPVHAVQVSIVQRFSIADPRDRGMLDVVGFDTAAPKVMADFARQR